MPSDRTPPSTLSSRILAEETAAYLEIVNDFAEVRWFIDHLHVGGLDLGTAPSAASSSATSRSAWPRGRGSRGTPAPEIVRVQWDRLPRLRNRIAQARDRHAQRARARHRHVAAGGAEMVLCAQHPDVLRCKPCTRRHVNECHDDRVAFECDGCGSRPRKITGVAFPTVVAGRGPYRPWAATRISTARS